LSEKLLIPLFHAEILPADSQVSCSELILRSLLFVSAAGAAFASGTGTGAAGGEWRVRTGRDVLKVLLELGLHPERNVQSLAQTVVFSIQVADAEAQSAIFLMNFFELTGNSHHVVNLGNEICILF
jgi:hypothetical protein